jgi:L-asparaginase II
MPLYNAAFAMARFCDPRDLPAERGSACRKITSAMTTYPEMVSAFGEFDEQLMRAGDGKIVCKRGAEGYQIIGLLPGVLRAEAPGVGIALKVSDGDPSRTALDLTHSNRVRPAVVLEVLRQLEILSLEQQEALAPFGPAKSIRNHRGMITGQSRPVFRLSHLN